MRTAAKTLLLIAAALVPAAVRTTAQEPRWFAAWGAAPNVGEVIPGLAGSTIRLIARPALPGQSLRIKLDNWRSGTPAVFSAVFIGRAGSAAAIVTGTNRPLTFNGSTRLTIAPGGAAWSDPIPFEVTAFERLTVSLDVETASDVSMHTLGLVTSYQASGRAGRREDGAAFAPISPLVPHSTVVEYPMFWLSAIDVLSPRAVGTIVAVGDSWVDGRCSTSDGSVARPDRYARWIDVLAERLAARSPNSPVGVVNAGIAGNRLVPPGGNGPPTPQRLERDVLERAGVTHVIALQGMNDLGQGTMAPQLTGAMRQVIDRVHARGVKIIGGTLFPLGRPDRAGWTRSMEEQRLAVNAWIRTQAPYDGMIDFDRVMSRGPLYDGAPSLPTEFLCEDLVHPNAAGYRAMGQFVDLDLFRPFGVPR